MDWGAFSMAVGAGFAGGVLVMLLRGPRTVYVPVFSGTAPLRVKLERPEAVLPRNYDPRAHLPKDIENRPKLGSMAEAYEAERKQLQQARREWPETADVPTTGTVTGASGVPVPIKAGDELSVTGKGEPVVRRPRRSRKKET